MMRQIRIDARNHYGVQAKGVALLLPHALQPLFQLRTSLPETTSMLDPCAWPITPSPLSASALPYWMLFRKIRRFSFGRVFNRELKNLVKELKLLSKAEQSDNLQDELLEYVGVFAKSVSQSDPWVDIGQLCYYWSPGRAQGQGKEHYSWPLWYTEQII